ncbi:MarR family winged helix-turn-helix transcriptional regulator [Planomonospora venezuelensis]|uniref:DNA-binding MarR family transcriptional regulator n=1 Tax=Planomonospora venezuelensis TaxID=1999 RepID=A0A841D0F8_PLAVE|nr:MarR family transcriptional regulator [Planomonospora venezuelensis]MBB5963210.1 DNA-binding MarR family transcriptional regulator [Planomonospora venezuelensis]GIN01374.1 MarR family transcriptional regulator [Planomonospora venezuelensis]
MENDVHNLSADQDGLLFDPRTRAAMIRFIGGEDTLALEAAAAVRTASHAIERMRAHGAGGRGLSSGALDILLRLGASSDGLSVGDLAQSAGVSSRNVTGLVDTLEREGLAQRTPAPHDRRSVLVAITPAGREWTENFRRPTQAAMAAVFRDFTPAELGLLRHLCLRLAGNHAELARHLEGTR